MDTKEKLDMLAEFHSQRDSIEAQKRALLDEVKIPDEVLDIQRNAAEAIEYQQKAGDDLAALLRSKMESEFYAVQVPPEVREILAKVDAERERIRAEYTEKIAKVHGDTALYRGRVNAETQEKTRKVYDDISRRKREIEEEFAGKVSDVSKNIAALEAEIKAEVKAGGQSVKGKYFHAVYVKGRVSWDTDMLDGMITLVPQLSQARKEGEPSITLRKI